MKRIDLMRQVLCTPRHGFLPVLTHPRSSPNGERHPPDARTGPDVNHVPIASVERDVVDQYATAARASRPFTELHAVHLVRQRNGLVGLGLGLDEATEGDHALVGLDIDVARLDLFIADQTSS